MAKEYFLNSLKDSVPWASFVHDLSLEICGILRNLRIVASTSEKILKVFSTYEKLWKLFSTYEKLLANAVV